MAVANRIEDEWLCSKVILRFFQCMDERRYDELLALTTDDCLWVRNGEELKGSEQIRAALDARSPTMHIHHILTNLEVDASENGTATMRAYLVSYRHDSGKPLDGPAPLDRPRAIFKLAGTLRKDDSRWQVSYLTNGKPSFLAATT